MGLESGTYISDLVATNPLSSDLSSTGDDHIRLLKSLIKATFPNISGAVTPTHTELNYVDGSDSSSYSGTLTGLTTSPTLTINYRRIGTIVCLSFGSQTGTSNATTFTITGAPAGIRPTSDSGYASIPGVVNNGTQTFGGIAVQMTSGGVLQFSISGSASGFTASGTKGTTNQNTVLCYPIL